MTTTTCPACGRTNDCHGSTQTPLPKPPKPGDYSICWGCHAVAMFDTGPLGNLVVRGLTRAEADAFAADTAMHAVIAAGLRAPDAVTAGAWARRAKRASEN